MVTQNAPHQQRRQDRGRSQHSRSSASGAPELIERVVQINHVAKVVKGGRRFSFSTVVVVGNGSGMVGAAIGKAKEVPESITKGRTLATKGMVKIKMLGGTIPHEIVGRCGSTHVLLKPAVPGTGIIAGKAVRAILESAGMKDILSKIIGSSNVVNVVKATMEGLMRLQMPEDIAELRGKAVGDLFIAKKSRRSMKMEEEAADAEASTDPDSPQGAGQSQRRRDMRGPNPNRPRPQGGAPGSDSRRFDRRPDRRPRPDDAVPPSVPGSEVH